MLGKWSEYFNDLLNPVANTPPDTHKVHLGLLHRPGWNPT